MMSLLFLVHWPLSLCKKLQGITSWMRLITINLIYNSNLWNPQSFFIFVTHPHHHSVSSCQVKQACSLERKLHWMLRAFLFPFLASQPLCSSVLISVISCTGEVARRAVEDLIEEVLGTAGIRKGWCKGITKSARFWHVVNRWVHADPTPRHPPPPPRLNLTDRPPAKDEDFSRDLSGRQRGGFQHQIQGINKNVC